MKKLLLIIVFFVGHHLFGQYKIDQAVQYTFDSLFSRQPKEIQDKRYIKGVGNGFALLVDFKEDTLNLKDFVPAIVDTSISIVSVDEKGEELPELPKDTAKFNQWLSCEAAYVNDTLDITTFFGLLSGFSFSVKLIGNKTICSFYEYSDGNKIYRNSFMGKKSTNATVGAAAKNVILSSMPKTLGEVFYGKLTLATNPFYVDNSEFKNDFIYKRYLVTILFTCPLVENGKKQHTASGD